MTTKHTPGPWRVDETKALGAYGVWTDYATHPGHDGAGYPSLVCSMVPTVKSEITREQRDANARLIAAAPDLLAACQESLAFISEIDFALLAELLDGRDSLLERLQAAVAKAKGE